MLTLVMAYYENPSMLRLHYREWQDMDERHRAMFRVIIVDDGSPRNPAADVIRENAIHPLDIRVLRIGVDIPWNQDGARNLGMQQCKTEWALLTDMDHMLPASQLTSAMLAVHKARPGTYYMPYRKQSFNNMKIAAPHPNSYLFNVSDFWSMGGYDEDFAGVYGSDGNFRRCMQARLAERQTGDFFLVQYRRDEIPDASTNDYGRKESKYYRANFPHLENKRRGPTYKAKNHIRFEWTEEKV
jgi:glycosyltransferase involved in cell wall biosynthesis